MHRLKGDRSGQWSVRVNANWHVVFRFEENEAADIDLIDYDYTNTRVDMSTKKSERVCPMLKPPHLGELIRESMDVVGWNVAETAVRLACER